jgi:hypothetical protein
MLIFFLSIQTRSSMIKLYEQARYNWINSHPKDHMSADVHNKIVAIEVVTSIGLIHYENITLVREYNWQRSTAITPPHILFFSQRGPLPGTACWLQYSQHLYPYLLQPRTTYRSMDTQRKWMPVFPRWRYSNDHLGLRWVTLGCCRMNLIVETIGSYMTILIVFFTSYLGTTETKIGLKLVQFLRGVRHSRIR